MTFFALLLAVAASAQPPLELRAGNIVIQYWPESQRMAELLLNSARTNAPFPGLPPDVVAQPPDIRILLAPDEARFDSITGGRVPDWGAGVALPQQGVIVLPGYNSARGGTHELRRVLRHELAHVALQRGLGPVQIARWFSEGYAIWTAGEFDENAGWMLRAAFIMRRAPPLDSISLEWPERVADARVAYLLSASAVEYLYSFGGEPTFRRFLDEWRTSQDFNHALRATYGLTFGQFDRNWNRVVKRRYGWLLFFAQATVIWTVLTLIVLVLFLIRRRRDRRKMARLRETELPDDPAWWLDENDDSRRDSEP